MRWSRSSSARQNRVGGHPVGGQPGIRRNRTGNLLLITNPKDERPPSTAHQRGLLQLNEDISIPPPPFVDRAVDLAFLPERDVAGFHAAADVLAALLLGY